MGKYEQEISTCYSQTRTIIKYRSTDIRVPPVKRRKREIDREIPRLHDPPRPHCRGNSGGRVRYK